MRYRIRYVVDPFEHDIEAGNMEEAKRVADELSRSVLMLRDIECHRSVIMPLGDDDDAAR